MNRQRWIIVAVILIVAVGSVGWWKSRHAEAAPKYRTVSLEHGKIESLVSATGTIRPVVQVEVGSQVSGTVQKLFADYNSRVRAGQVLCQLEPSSFRARAAQAEASVARAEAALRDARRQHARAKELFEKNYVSQADVEGAEIAVEQRAAELKQARAQLDAAKVDLANTTIHAPIDGVVIARSVDLGQTVAASLQAPKLFVIANDLARMQVETRIDEADIGLIHPDLPVRFTVDAFPEATFDGRVAQVRLEPIVEQGVVTYTTVIHTENPDFKLRPGMTANVSVLVAKRDDALKIPNAALRFRPPPERGAGGGRAEAAMRGNGGGGMGPGGADNGMRAGGTAMGPGGKGPRSGGEPGMRAGGDGMGRGGKAMRMGGGGMRGADGGSMRMGGENPRGGARSAAADGVPSGAGFAEGALKPGAVYVLRAGKPVRVSILSGLTDGAYTEVKSDELKQDDQIIVGLEMSARGANLQPPPGMGGPMFGGPPRPSGGGGGGRR